MMVDLRCQHMVQAVKSYLCPLNLDIRLHVGRVPSMRET